MNYILIMLFINISKHLLFYFLCYGCAGLVFAIGCAGAGAGAGAIAIAIACVLGIGFILVIFKYLLPRNNNLSHVNMRKSYATNCYRSDNNRGFSFIEILLVMLLVSFFLTSAVPKWRYFCVTQQMRVTVAQLQSMFVYARNIAVSKQRQIELCGSSDQQNCDGDWSSFVLVRYAGQSGDVSLLRVSDALPKGWSIHWQSSLGHNASLLFFPDASFAGQRGSFYVDSPPDADHLERRLVVSLSGRLHVE